jgi:AraC-like DNA-binding protein
MAEPRPDISVHAESGFHHTCAPDWGLPPRTRPTTQFWIITGGRGEMTVTGVRHALDPGVVVTILPDVQHKGRHDARSPLRCYVVHATTRVLGAVVPDALAPLPTSLRPGSDAWRDTTAAADKIRSELAGRETACQLAADAAATQLVAVLWREASSQGLLESTRRRGDEKERNPQHEAIDAAMHYIALHYWERITLAQLARATHFSRAHLSTSFRRATGMAPFEYLHRYRMRRARDLLETTRLSVAEIAATVGMPDPFHFSRAFKRSEGTSPSHYRESRRPADGP